MKKADERSVATSPSIERPKRKSVRRSADGTFRELTIDDLRGAVGGVITVEAAGGGGAKDSGGKGD
jgi:hypothetical protein